MWISYNVDTFGLVLNFSNQSQHMKDIEILRKESLMLKNEQKKIKRQRARKKNDVRNHALKA